jgi:carbon-monoxide dehydrogenase medium subunit
MIPSSFDYVRATSIEEAILFLRESEGEGKLLAGGHSLIPLMKFRISTPKKIIDISKIQGLKGVKKVGERIVVGALTTYAEILKDPIVLKYTPVLAETAKQVGDMQVRNVGTVGGSIAHADPAADLPAVALALDATVHLIDADGEEEIPIKDFILGPLVTALPETSILSAVSFAIPPANSVGTYLKFAHPASGYAVVGVCTIGGKSENGAVDYIRVGITGAGDMAFRAVSLEQNLLGKKPTEDVIGETSKLAPSDGEMGEDLFATAEYRKQLCQVFTERALKEVFK